MRDGWILKDGMKDDAELTKMTEAKYGNAGNGAAAAVDAYHRSRRMFCIYNGKLTIAAPGLSYSHAVWFEKEGWVTTTDDSLLTSGVRGILNSEGELHFYTGYDFEVNDEIEKSFFEHLQELVDGLGLSLDTKVFGGAIKSPPGTKWPTRKAYGRIKELLNGE